MSIDRLLIELDGTPNKGARRQRAARRVDRRRPRRGGVARPAAVPVPRRRGGARLPVPQVNILNGGKHAIDSTDFQEFMIVPLGAPTFREALRWASETFHALGKLLRERGFATTVGDEGGYAPSLEGNEAAIALVLEAIERAGYTTRRAGRHRARPGRQRAHERREYVLASEGDAACPARSWSTSGRTGWRAIRSSAWRTAWARTTGTAGGCSPNARGAGSSWWATTSWSPTRERLARGINERSANSILIKLNQIGTLTETLEAIEMAHRAGWTAVVSHRSGETEDTTIADLVVAVNGGQIKTGSISRSERIAKYNRLLRIEEELGDAAEFAGRRAFSALR